MCVLGGEGVRGCKLPACSHTPESTKVVPWCISTQCVPGHAFALPAASAWSSGAPCMGPPPSCPQPTTALNMLSPPPPPHRPAKAGRHNIALYTYGAPRVGNGAFADAFHARLAPSSSWRFYNPRDIVPSVPRLMGYKHVRTGMHNSSRAHTRCAL